MRRQARNGVRAPPNFGKHDPQLSSTLCSAAIKSSGGSKELFRSHRGTSGKQSQSTAEHLAVVSPERQEPNHLEQTSFQVRQDKRCRFYQVLVRVVFRWAKFWLLKGLIYLTPAVVLIRSALEPQAHNNKRFLFMGDTVSHVKFQKFKRHISHIHMKNGLSTTKVNGT